MTLTAHSGPDMEIDNEYMTCAVDIEGNTAVIHGHLHIKRWSPGALKHMRKLFEPIRAELRERGVKYVLLKSEQDYYRMARLAYMWGFRAFCEPYARMEI